MPKHSPLALLSSALFSLVVAGCAVSDHPVQASSLGVSRATSDLEALIDQPGPLHVETVRAARWSVPRSGLLNLDDPQARAAGLADGPEPIEIYFHAVRHPSRGLYIIDSGVERALAQHPEQSAVGSVAYHLAGLASLSVEIDLATWLEQREPLAGVLLTHLHLDHILGLPDVPQGTPLYTGPGETEPVALLNLATQPITDGILEGHAALREWPHAADRDQRFAGVVDIFGDGSFWALHVPGHTPGSTAFVARTPRGAVLFTGDACHTRFGWDNAVEPGTFSLDQAQSEHSLLALEALVERHPGLEVRLGHQEHAGEARGTERRSARRPDERGALQVSHP